MKFGVKYRIRSGNSIKSDLVGVSLIIDQKTSRFKLTMNRWELIRFLKISKYIWDPARGGVLEAGGPGGGLPPPGTAAVSKHQTGTVTKQTTRARWGGLWDPAPGGVLEDPPPGTAAVSKHQTGTVTKQATGARWGGPGGVPPPGTAAVSKHQTGTVTRLLCDDWGDHPSAKKSRFFVPWKAGGPSPN